MAERRWGGKRLWVAALLIFVIGSVLSATSWNGASPIGFRVLQGFGGGLIFPLIQTPVVRAAGGRPSSNLMATVSLPVALGPILGPVIGGMILNWLSRRLLFLVNVPVIAVGLLLAWRLLPADRPHPSAGRARLDVIGIVLLAAFVAWARRPGDRRPIVEVRLLRLRSLGTASAVLFTAGAAMYAGMFLLPLYCQQLRGESVLDARLLMIPQRVGAPAARFVIGKLVTRFGARLVTITSFLLAAVATVPFAFAGPGRAGPGMWWLGAVLLVRGRDRRRPHPDEVGRLPGHTVGRHPARDHEHPYRRAGRRFLRHRRRGRRPAVGARPRRHGRLPGSVLVGDRHHDRCALPLLPLPSGRT